MICAYCEGEFTPNANNQKYCQVSCQKSASWYSGKKKKDITPVNGRAKILSEHWPYEGIFHWGEIREWAEYGTCPPDAVFVDVNDPTIRFGLYCEQTTMDEETTTPQKLVRIESE